MSSPPIVSTGPPSPGTHRPADRAEVRSAPADVPRIAIAGATGFVGAALAKRLEDSCRVIALGRRFPAMTSRTTGSEAPEPGIEPRRCELFSVRETKAALEGASVAVYLVHSMSPNARLTQGRFEDLDLLLADNFGRAAAEAGVERIVYLGGLIPDSDPSALSAHLASRLEVESALGAHGVPVTAVRAGLVVGQDGSSLRILVRLVERLPVMVCPSWTKSLTQPIALSDVIAILEYVCRHPETAGRICEVGGRDVLSYRDMMRITARVLGRRRRMLSVPVVTPGLSELWVSLVTGTSRSLVRPLVGSLRHPMVVSDPWLQEAMGLPGRGFEEALREALQGSRLWKRPIARSVQRLPLPPGRDVQWVGEAYPRWLRSALPWMLATRPGREGLEIRLRGWRRPLLILRPETGAVADGRFVFGVVGGALAARRPKGEPRLEFRRAPDGTHVLAALQDYEPSLPWWLYLWTQAIAHRAVMSAYRRYLARLAKGPAQRSSVGEPSSHTGGQQDRGASSPRDER